MTATGIIAGLVDLIATVLSFLIAVGVVVFVHEFGHYVAARWSGIRVGVFSIGFGKSLLAWQDSRGTIWKIGAVPLGGYVRFLDSAPETPADGDDRTALRLAEGDSLTNAALGHRILTVAAGPVANFLFSTVVFALIALIVGIVPGAVVVGTLKPLPQGSGAVQPGDQIMAVNGNSVTGLADLYLYSDQSDGGGITLYTVDRDGAVLEASGPALMPPVIAGVRLMSAADDAGLREGDVVLAVDGAPVRAFGELRRAVQASAGQPMILDVWRNGREFRLDLLGKEETVPVSGGGFEQRLLIGVTGGLFFEPVTRTPALLDAVLAGAGRTAAVVTGTMQGAVAIVSAKISSCNLQGPIGIARISKAAATQGAFEFLTLIAAISAVIGFLNLLPIPGLDGGHLAFYGFEAVFRRTPSTGFQRISISVGLVLVVMLMTYGLFNDLTCT